jgi:antitoxin Phd
MSGAIWSVQDAKNRFSAVVEAAQREPQTVTKHGKPAVVVVDAAEYARLKHLERLETVPFTAHLLAMPADNDSLDRLDGDLRKTDL